MGRYPQLPATRGSQRWLQLLVDEHPDVLNRAIGLGPITWRSPLAVDDYAEYRDIRFLKVLGIQPTKRPLERFWPSGGPQWDALGIRENSEPVLVEAKAHVAEMTSKGCMALGGSLSTIRTALEETARFFGCASADAWTSCFYQYANRLAHAYWLNELNGIRARLVFLYIVGDQAMNGPASRQSWESARNVLFETLGLTQELPDYVTDAFVDIREISGLQKGRS